MEGRKEKLAEYYTGMSWLPLTFFHTEKKKDGSRAKRGKKDPRNSKIFLVVAVYPFSALKGKQLVGIFFFFCTHSLRISAGRVHANSFRGVGQILRGTYVQVIG